jgi:hypothetical protein
MVIRIFDRLIIHSLHYNLYHYYCCYCLVVDPTQSVTMAYTPYGSGQQQQGQIASYDVNGNLVGYTTPNTVAQPSGYYGAAMTYQPPAPAASHGGGGGGGGYYQDPGVDHGDYPQHDQQQPQTQMYMDPRTGQYYAVPITAATGGGGHGGYTASRASPTNIELSGGIYGNNNGAAGGHANYNSSGYGGAGYADPGPQITVSETPIATHAGHNNGNLTYATPSNNHSSPAAVSPLPLPQPAISPSQPAIAYVDAHGNGNGNNGNGQQQPNVFHAATVTVTRPDTSRAHHDDSDSFWGHVKANVLGLDAMQKYVTNPSIISYHHPCTTHVYTCEWMVLFPNSSKDNFRAAAQRNPKLVQDEEDKEAAEEHQSLENIPLSITPADLIKPYAISFHVHLFVLIGAYH